MSQNTQQKRDEAHQIVNRITTAEFKELFKIISGENWSYFIQNEDETVLKEIARELQVFSFIPKSATDDDLSLQFLILSITERFLNKN